MSEGHTALLLIAHGSRRAEANADLDFIAAAMRENAAVIQSYGLRSWNWWNRGIEAAAAELCTGRERTR